jgi:hypothetical protein
MQPPRQRAVIVAPEVAARIVAARVAGQSLSMITGCLHLTPGEVRARWASPRSRPGVDGAGTWAGWLVGSGVRVSSLPRVPLRPWRGRRPANPHGFGGPAPFLFGESMPGCVT